MEQRRESAYKMISCDEALDIVLEHSEPLKETETLPMAEPRKLLGRIVSENIESTIELPPFPASLKDGYCLYVKEGTTSKNKIFKVKGKILAGQNINAEEHFSQPLSDDEVYQIMTGAAVPPNCNCVVMIENTKVVEFIEESGKEGENNAKSPYKQEKSIEITTEVSAQKNGGIGLDIRPVGSDLKIGDRVLHKGERIGASDIAILSSIGIQQVKVYRVPKIAIISTGDELIDPLTPNSIDLLKNEPGKIMDSNRLTLFALLNEISGNNWEIIDCGIALDNPQHITQSIERGLDVGDIVITSGGVSMGEVDLVKNWLENNSEVHFGRILMKPGKPLTFASTIKNNQKKLIFATPGNPVSCMVTSLLFVIPSLRKLSGSNYHRHPVIQVKLSHSIKLDPQRPEYHRAIVQWTDSGFVAKSTGIQESSRLLSMKTANALLLLPRSDSVLTEGSQVDALLFGSL